MSLNEQATSAVTALVAEVANTELDDDTIVLARLAWMDGYKAGIEASSAKMDEVFANWKAAQS